MKKFILTLLLFGLAMVDAMGQGGNDKAKIIYKYKKYEKFDLGNLEIKGRIIAPGDLTVKERKRKIFNRKLYNRLDFDSEVKRDLQDLR